MFRRRRSACILCMVVVSLCTVLRFGASATADTGRELAELLESEAAASATAPPPYALFHAFDAATELAIARSSILGDLQTSPQAKADFLASRRDGLMDSARTVVGKGEGASIDACFYFHSRYFFKPSSHNASTSSLQLWPYFYQHANFLADASAQTHTQTLHGVLDVDAAAFSLIAEVRSQREVELVLLAYNDWDAYAEEALAALANFTRTHNTALYSPSGPSHTTSLQASRCGESATAGREEVMAIRCEGLAGVATTLPSTPHGAAAATAKYATLHLDSNAAATGEAVGVLQLVGAARMSAFSGAQSAATEAFVKLHRSASPRLYFLTSHNIGTMALDSSATTASPPAVVAQHGFTAADVHRFVHQHTGSSLLLASKQAYYVALQLHQRIVVLIGRPEELPEGWWSSLSKPAHATNARLRALRHRTPFFLSESAGPIPNVTTASSPLGLRRCVLPTLRPNVEAAVRVVHGDAFVDAQLKTLAWRSDVLQLRIVEQRPPRDSAEDCQWVQPIELPCPSAQTDWAFYDAAVMGAVDDLLQRVHMGEGDWVARLRSTADFSRQLDHLLRPSVSRAAARVSLPPALLIAVEAVQGCTSAHQALYRKEREGNGAAAAIFASMSARLTTVEEELSIAATVVSLSTLPALLPSASSRMEEWQAHAARCPLFVIMRETEEIFCFTTEASHVHDTAASLESIDDAALAIALMDLHSKLPVDGAAADEGGKDAVEPLSAELHSALYTTKETSLRWRVVLPAGMEAPLLVYDVPQAAQGLLTATVPPDVPTFVLLVLRDCGVCSNYWKAFELLRVSYQRIAGSAQSDAQQRRAQFVLVDLELGFAGSRDAALRESDSDVDRAHWRRAEAILLPFYLSNVKALKVPQLLVINATHVSTTLPTEAYAERWHWPHALMRVMALSDAAMDANATTSSMWETLTAERVQREPLRNAST